MHEVCAACAAPLTRDEIALTKKLINRGTTQFYCYECLAKHFQVTVALLHEKVEQFREMGCVLFN